MVAFTDKTTDLSGTLQTPAGQPAPDYHVIVFLSIARTGFMVHAVSFAEAGDRWPIRDVRAAAR